MRIALVSSILMLPFFLFSQFDNNTVTLASAESIFIDDVLETSSTAEKADWAFHQDKENNLLYIDFESLGGNITHLILKKKDGEVIFNEDLMELPSNLIYEIDLKTLDHGDYVIELLSYTDTIKKLVSVD